MYEVDHHRKEGALSAGMELHTKPITHIVLHHSATRVLPLQEALAAFRESHTAKGWLDIGYHYLVHPDGSWCVAREPKYVGSHVKGMNDGKIGICLIGDYSSHDGSNAWHPGVEAELPFVFWECIKNIRWNLRYRHMLNELRLDNPRYYTHNELMPGHTDCGRGVIQRLVNELNEEIGVRR